MVKKIMHQFSHKNCSMLHLKYAEQKCKIKICDAYVNVKNQNKKYAPVMCFILKYHNITQHMSKIKNLKPYSLLQR